MELLDFFKEIESTSFQSKYMIYSGFKLVRKAISRDKTVASLINEARLYPAYIDDIGKRILFLCAENTDRPGATFDIAVATYLYCLYNTDQHFAKRVSEYVLQMGKLWWSVDLALHIKKNMAMFTDPVKWNFRFYGEPTPTENASWGADVLPMQMKENVAIVVNGERLCDISGRFSVRSRQLTQTQMRSA